MRTLSILFAPLVVVGTAAQVSAGSDCGGNDPDRRIDYRSGEQQSFKYVSRIEKTDGTARNYIWCIENKERYFVLNFRWGNRNNDKLYYSGLVEPQKMSPTSNTFSGEQIADIRFLKYKHTYENDSAWRQFDVETVFPRVLGTLKRRVRFAELIQGSDIVLTQNIESLDAFRDQYGEIDVPKLSNENRNLFVEYLKASPIDIRMTTIVTVPTNLNALELLSADKYEKYNPDDFVRLEVSFENIVQMADVPVSTVRYSVNAEDRQPDTLKRVQAAISQLQIFTELSPVIEIGLPNLAAALIPRDAFERYEVKEGQEAKVLFAQKLDKVSYIRSVFRVGTRKSNLTFSQVPVRLLVADK